ncbi:MAG TPA: LysM peptidoglycan-binding domain-containing protein, partial [Candidatus Binatia bacterium]|nr:LysM peptidoglycan-binding domain-containing protein [Candidatus Binatia bacterium]
MIRSESKLLITPIYRAKGWRQQLSKVLGRKRTIRYSAVGINVILLGVVLLIISRSSTVQTASQLSSSSSTASVTATTDPLDQLSAAQIAVSIANMVQLPEATAVKDQAETVSAELAVAPSEEVVIAKPQVVATALKSREDITTYTALSGDTIASLAAKFGVTSSSIAWSNNLTTSSSLQVGQKLTIPPVNGIVYTVKAGDTPQSLAATYESNATQIIAYNNAEISGLQAGEQIIIPNGQAPVVSEVQNFYPSFGANGYDFGYCTWYVASQIAVPSNWGNASSWSYYAALSGWTVSSSPQVGAIAQTPYAAGGEGHVAIVDAVSADGSQIQFRDMNGLAGWD